ncbi:BMP family protein [Paracoccus sp. IB05]|uniref:BMP family lipoprotein n=1 Tax=Paracoccus sp. IB05 TaxID=2779367 RepID=UPI0018E787B0|nr:BMP family ABC transporter substrate-binding protein [Paracoccus sp. IB05]MBJ2151297.1 BMP family ABC transporter substrate-binding protein [Paracoccus sp. IB05]
MTLATRLAQATAVLALVTGAAGSASLAEPALIFDLGGKFDKSFNEAAYNGAERWKAETGGTYQEFEMREETQREQSLRRMAENGANPVVTTGFGMSDPIARVAPDFPDTKFVTIDGWVDPAVHPNVLSINFREEEGSYLTGMLAAQASKTGTVGFVGGMNVPLIRAFGCGFAQGAKAVNPDIKFVSSMTGDTPDAWNDPVKGSEQARALKAQGADVIFAAAGQTGLGVLQAAADEGILSVGVDSNQNHLHPGKVLTSMLKRVDVAVYNSFIQGEALDLTPQLLGLKEDGVGYALDDNNAALITPEMKASVDAAAAAIIAGELKVHDYRSDNTCPAAPF